MARILIVEDEDNIGELVEINLRLSGYDTKRATSAEEAKAFIDAGEKFEIAILDIMLPGMNGISLCEQIRSGDNRIGIIMLSAKGQEQDKVIALSAGADDYVTKPFGVSELLARISSLLRRLQRSNGIVEYSDTLTSGPFVLDEKSHQLTKNGENIDLTSVEFSIMELFIKNEGTALKREQILDGVWGENYYGDIKIVDVNIRRLRMKVETDASNPEYIITVWGYGYRWNAQGSTENE